MANKDTRHTCCLCGQRINWGSMAALYTKRAHWECNDAAPPEARLVLSTEGHAKDSPR